MALIHLNSTPSDPAQTLHFNRPPRWCFTPGIAALDGQVETRTIQGVETAMLLKQPYKPGRYVGISMFTLQCDLSISKAAHEFLGRK